jgi:hypothetical protein
MIVLPNEAQLINSIIAAHDAVGARYATLEERDWNPALKGELATRLHKLPPGLMCLARNASPAACVNREWLWDFCAGIVDPDAAVIGQNVAQLAVVGEIEQGWGSAFAEVEKDFSKLFAADSLICFMTFQGPLDASNLELDRLEAAVRRRQDYVRLRGNRPPPFVLTCWCWKDEDKFWKYQHRVIRPFVPTERRLMARPAEAVADHN